MERFSGKNLGQSIGKIVFLNNKFFSGFEISSQDINLNDCDQDQNKDFDICAPLNSAFKWLNR